MAVSDSNNISPILDYLNPNDKKSEAEEIASSSLAEDGDTFPSVNEKLLSPERNMFTHDDSANNSSSMLTTVAPNTKVLDIGNSPFNSWISKHGENSPEAVKIVQFLLALQEIANIENENDKKNTQDAIAFSKDAIIQQIYALLHSLKNINELTSEDIESLENALIPHYRLWDKRSIYAGRCMLAAYCVFVGISVGAAIAGFGSYGFGSSYAEGGISSFWDAEDGLAAFFGQSCIWHARKKSPTALINHVGEVAMLSAVGFAGYELAMGATEYAFGALGFGFAIANFASALVEYNTAQNARERRNKIYSQLANTIQKLLENDKKIDGTEINEILKTIKAPSVSWQTGQFREYQDSVKLVQNCAKLEKLLRQTIKTNEKTNKEAIAKCSALCDLLALENARYNKGLLMASSLVVCGFAMTMGALLVTSLVGASHGTAALMLPFINSGFTAFSALMRFYIETGISDVDNVHAALNQKNQELLQNKQPTDTEEDDDNEAHDNNSSMPVVSDLEKNKDTETTKITGKQSYTRRMVSSLCRYLPFVNSSNKLSNDKTVRQEPHHS